MSGDASHRDQPEVYERRKPGPKKRFTHMLKVYVTEYEYDAVVLEASLQTGDLEENISQADVVRQCIRQALELEE